MANGLWNTTHRMINNHLKKPLEDPHIYDCSVLAYIRGHHQMLIELIEPVQKNISRVAIYILTLCSTLKGLSVGMALIFNSVHWTNAKPC